MKSDVKKKMTSFWHSATTPKSHQRGETEKFVRDYLANTE